MMREPTTSQLTLWSADDAAGDWAMRESPRARRLTVRVFRNGRVEVVVPRRTAQRSIVRFLDEHRVWIERKRAEAKLNAVPAQPFPPQRIEFAVCDESWRIHLTGSAGRARVKVLAPGLLGIVAKIGDTRSTKHALRRWLMGRAHDVIAPMLHELARELNLKYTKLVIRRQRTRWGSCSTRGTISLNCCLLFQRPDVVRYLLIHELAHTLHMNHSRRFWRCVAGHCPAYERLDGELREGWRGVPIWVFDA